MHGLVFFVMSIVISDIDECTLDTDDCETNALCSDTDGSYSCTCKKGYTGDGFKCVGEYEVQLCAI